MGIVLDRCVHVHKYTGSVAATIGVKPPVVATMVEQLCGLVINWPVYHSSPSGFETKIVGKYIILRFHLQVLLKAFVTIRDALCDTPCANRQ